MSGRHGGRDAHHGGGLREAAIVLFLVGALVLLHRFAVPARGDGFDPTAMLALGFVVLAGHAIGQLAEVMRLPHITGYLLGGVLFGASFAHYLPAAWQIPPFDRGVLSPEVIDKLGLLDALAVALIATTAGGELRFDALRKGLGALLGTLAGQLVAALLLVTGLLWAFTGGMPALALPGMPEVTPGAALALGAAVAAIAFATSPAATLAVIQGSGAQGPLTRLLLSAVVLKDVLVVVLFSVASSLAARQLGIAQGGGSLGSQLAVHLAGSLALGSVMGGVTALYLRFVGRELLLYIVALVYLGTFLCQRWHLDPVLAFLATGVVVTNASRRGDQLIHELERLSGPVYVVFFTLAGARLHLEEVFALAPHALGLVAVRALAFAIGSRFGARLGGAEPPVVRYGWMGFLSQAGVALSLSAVVGRSLGEAGQAISTLLLASIAINEVIGPVLLELSLRLAGEAGGGETADAGTPGETAETPADPTRAARRAAVEEVRLPLSELESELRRLLAEAREQAIEEQRHEALAFLHELRQEGLRLRRALRARARAALERLEEDAEPAERVEAAREAVAEGIAEAISELASHWRDAVLVQGSRAAHTSWAPELLVREVDEALEALPAQVQAAWEEASFEPREGESRWQRLLRARLRFSRRLHGWFGLPLPRRRLPLRDLARYHLGAETPARLEGVAALLLLGERQLAVGSQALFEQLRRRSREVEAQVREGAIEPERAPELLQRELDEGLSLLRSELGRTLRDAEQRLRGALLGPLARVHEEAVIFGTFDLPARARRFGPRYRQRARALEALAERYPALRRALVPGFARVGLQLELSATDGRLQRLAEPRFAELRAELRGRTVAQLERVARALAEATGQYERALREEAAPERLAERLEALAQAFSQESTAAARAADELPERLGQRAAEAGLLELLSRGVADVTERYEIGALPARSDWRLPALPPAPVEVPFRELLRAQLETRMGPAVAAALREAAGRVSPLGAALHEVERLVAFNVEVARGELELGTAGEREGWRALVEELVGGALQRAEATVSGWLQQAAPWPEQLAEELQEALQAPLADLRRELLEGVPSRARIEALRRSAAGRRILQRAESLPEQLAEVARYAQGWTLELLGEERARRWRRVLGLPAARRVPGQEAFAPPRPRVQLPLVYERLFTPDTLEAGDVLIGRGAEVARAAEVLGSERRLRAVALVGPDGVGKGAVSRAIERSRSWRKVQRIVFDGPTSAEQVERLFDQPARGTLRVVEGLHWLVAMRPGGFEPLRRFVEGVLAGGAQCGWLVHADPLVWRYAGRIAPLQEAFGEVLWLRPLDQEELTSALLARHALSGFTLSFGKGAPGGRLERGLGRLLERWTPPSRRYFRELHQASGGLVRDALRLWLASIDEVDERQDIVHMGPLPPSPASALRRLPEEQLLELYLTARQGWIDPDVLAWQLRVPRRSAEARLLRLADEGILEQVGEPQREIFRVAVHLRGALARVLGERGWAR